MKRSRGFGIWVFIAGVLLITLVAAFFLVQVSPLQHYLKEKVSSYLTERTGMETNIGKVKIVFPAWAGIENLEIKDHHQHLMLRSSSVTLTLTTLNLRQRVVRIGTLRLKDIYLNQKRYDNEELDNLSLYIARLGGEDPEDKPPGEPFIIRCNRLKLSNGEYSSSLKERRNNSTGIDFSNLHLTDINADFSNLSIVGQIVSVKINDFNARDHSGFRITGLKSYADISPTSIKLRSLTLETNQTAISLDLSFHYQSFEDFKDFLNKVYIKGHIGVTSLSTYDLGYFVPLFFRTNNQINLSGRLEGLIRNFKTKDFQFSVGGSSFDGAISMNGLPDFENTFITLDINHLVADPADIGHFHINDNGAITSIPLPKMLYNLGMVSVIGSFDGTYRDFYTNAGFTGTFGSVNADMRLAQADNRFTVSGTMGLENVDAGSIVNYSDLGMVSMFASLDGSGTMDHWDIDIDGLVFSAGFMGYEYQNIDITGRVVDKMFSGEVAIDDKNIDLNFNGILDFNSEIPVYNFIADIKNANLVNLGLVTDTFRGLLSTNMSIDFQGNRIDNLAGLININFTEFKTPSRNYQLDHFELSAFSSPVNRRKFIAIRSDYLDGDIHGNFSFDDIRFAIEEYSRTYISGLLQPAQEEDTTGLAAQQNDIHFDLSFKNTGNITYLLTGTRIESEKLVVRGSFMAEENNLNIFGSAEMIGVEGTKAENLQILVYQKDQGIIIETGASELFRNDTIGVYEPYFQGIINDNLLSNRLTWKFNRQSIVPDATINSKFNLKDYPNFILTFGQGTVVINDTTWEIREGSGLSYSGNILTVNNILFYNHGQSIRIDGSASSSPDHTLSCSFKQIDLSWIDFLTVPHQVNLDGMIDGNVTINQLFDSPKILADLSVQDFAFNDDPLGALKILSVWDDQKKGMKLSADFIYHGNIGERKTAEISGYLFPMEKKGENFDLSFDLDNFRINMLSAFLSDITSDIRGYASGRLNLTGPFSRPKVTGKLKVNARNIFVDYLNTSYSFADSIIFTPTAIIFNNIQLSDNNRLNLRDPYTGVLHGSIGHNGFRDFSLNLTIRAENFTFLNTNGQQDPMYFGRALATGNISITGPVEDILIKVQARTERHTMLEIPLNYSSEVTKSSFITFIERRDDADIATVTARRTAESNLSLNFDLQVTPDATVRLVFDPLVGDVIEGNGSGNLAMNIDSKGEFDLRGQYVISRGDYIFNLENLISKKFTVKPGGTIRWTGDPYDALMDIEAVYSTKASLTPLNMEDSTLSAQNVDCIIHMTDNLFNPTIDFRIEFPDMTTFDNEKYQALVRPNINYHFLSLLAASRFVNIQSQQFLETGGPANIAGLTTTELLANQLSVWLSNISNDFDVDFAYHPGSGLTAEQIEAAIKTQVLNDRLTIESRVGFGGRAYAEDAQRTSNMVGDVVAEYRIDREGRFRIKAFNRYNEQSILYEGADYTQGVGVFYRKEFNSLIDLFRRKQQEQQE